MILESIGYSIHASQVVAIGASSTQSTSLSNTTFMVRLVCDADCFIAIGTNPTATTSSTLLPAGVVEYFKTRIGEIVAVIEKVSGGTGNLNLSEMVR